MPYSWGDDTSTWNNPGTYDYGSARRAYVDPSAPTDPRVYNKSIREPNMKLVNPYGKTIRSGSKNPIIVGIDCTGSMAAWPAEIFDRLPLFCQSLAKYRPDVEISFSVIGDAYSDAFPLQTADFAKGPALDEILNAFYPEGGGGGQNRETYELWAYYMLNHAETPNAESPFMIVMGDEAFYDTVNASQISHYTGDSAKEDLDSRSVWNLLKQRYNLFLLHKPYVADSDDADVLACWYEVLGQEHVVKLPSKERAVDVAMGLIARSWGHLDDFTTNMSARQDSSTVDSVVGIVNKSIKDPDASGKSSIINSKGGPKSKPLS